MHEDKLTHRQRIRLEALAQTQIGAANGLHFNQKPSTEDILKKAEEIENWLLKADQGIN